MILKESNLELPSTKINCTVSDFNHEPPHNQGGKFYSGVNSNKAGFFESSFFLMGRGGEGESI